MESDTGMAPPLQEDQEIQMADETDRLLKGPSLRQRDGPE
jgi:hypothetical protein